MTSNHSIAVAQIIKPHGVRGAVNLYSFTDETTACCHYGPVYLKNGRQFTIRYKSHKDNKVRAQLAGIENREQAEELRGEILFVARTVLPTLEDKDLFYHTDLVEMIAFREDDQPVGKVIALHNHGSCDLLEIKPIEGETVLLPFTRQYVHHIDPITRYLRITLPCEAS